MLESMARDAIINVRIDPQDKRTLERAAKARGLTLSAFVVRSLLAEAENTPRRGRSRGKVPPMFRTACEEAKRGGAGGYLFPGRLLILHAHRVMDDEVTEQLAEIVFAWQQAQPHLKGFAGAARESALMSEVLVWCEAHFPECLALVPERRRAQFARGLLEAYEGLEDEQDEELLRGEKAKRGEG